MFDDFVVGTTQVFTDAKWNSQLALADKVRIVATADSVTGSLPTLEIHIQESADGRNWFNKNTTGEIPNTSPLTVGGVTTLWGSDPGTTPMSGFARLAITLGGTTPVAHLKVYVTGRGDIPVSS